MLVLYADDFAFELVSLLIQNDNDYVITYGGPMAHVRLRPCDLPLRVCKNYLLNVTIIKLSLHSLHSYAGSLTRQGKALGTLIRKH